MRTLAALAYLLLAGLAGPAAAAEIEVDVELVLAVDVSRSMTPRELEIQRRGYAEALVSPEVLDAIRFGARGQVAITYVEWAGAHSQRVVVGWTLIRTPADARAFSEKLTAHFDSTMRRTSISGALDFAAGLFAGNGFTGLSRVIDVSGDGPNNDGQRVDATRDAVLARGIAINGLPLMTREGLGYQWHLEDLDIYYQECVIGGAGAFVIPVLEWRHFPRAVRRKLALELVGRPPEVPPVTPAAAQASYDCLVGEKIWEDLMDGWN